MKGNKTNHPKRGGYYTGGNPITIAKRRIQEQTNDKEPFDVLVQKMKDAGLRPRKYQFYWRHILCRYFLYDEFNQADFRWVITNCTTGVQATIRPRDYAYASGGVKWRKMAGAAKKV